MRITTVLRSFLLLLAFAAALCGIALQPARAALQATPAWWGASAAASSSWHYRVPLTLPGTPAANATAVFNVDFNALLASLGISGTFDVNSPRVVAADGTLVPTQEFTDAMYNGATDAAGNGRGEIRFLTNSTATTYWLYFDITQNGTKAANTAAAIDGNFENPGAIQNNLVAPTGWTVTRNAGAIDTQVRPTEAPSVTADGTTVGNGASPRTVDGAPRSGLYSFLIGARSANESQNGQDIMQLQRTIVVPATNPGVLKVRFRVQGWDSNDNGNTGSFDYLEAAITGTGITTNNFIGPLANNYTTLPFSPNKGTTQAGRSNSGYGQYNGFDTDTRGTHRAGMTVAAGSEPWWEATVDLTPYAGRSITLSFTTSHITQYRSWWHIDDVEWSVINGTVGTPQGFGAALELPSAATPVQYPGDVLTIRARLDGVGKTGAVVADLYRPDGNLVKAGILLYNDGTHGDATSGDALWTNNGSVAAQATYTFSPSDPVGAWSVVLRAADSSSPVSGQSAGLVRVPGQPVTPVNGTNFSNVDVQAITFSPFMAISGKVYRDSNQNGALDGGEPAAAGMYVKLVQNGTVLVATPDGNGAYAFTGLRAGTYTVLQSTNNNTGDTSPSVPSGAVQTEPSGGGSRTITLSSGVSVTANFGQYTAVNNRLTGKIFADSGAGNVNALDGSQGGSEPALAGLTVTLRNAAGTTVATAVTGGDGQFELALPSSLAGTQVTLVVPAVTGYELARFGAGNTNGTVSLAAGTLVFTPGSGNDYSGVVASMLPISTLVQGQAKTMPPGGVATYAHRFNADANGTVSFALSSQPPSSLPQWQGLLYRDNDCNGVIDGSDALLQSSVQVLAGGSVCVIVRDLVPQSASINMVNQHQLSATFVVTQGVGYTAAPAVNLDLTTVGTTTGSGLTLTKAVRNLTTGSGWDTAGQAVPGQSLQYRLTFRNDTASPITSVQVNDFLPAYGVFQSAACGTMPAGLACSVSTSPAAGATTGAIQWTFTGPVAPGATGEVTFNWMLAN
ncbi:SdrD B-like domain-containing protein [Ramlibacter sp. AN1133]|uniref:SdrD B-like domain-containing protein n=1 Tax=Ramlibacter sp. AN1133 TaxID=3133429 RepID=UPI0030BEDFAC